MATKIKIITAGDFLEVTPDGVLNIATSRQLLVAIARAEHSPVDYELLIDFRATQCNLSIGELYQLARELCQHSDTFRLKVALLVFPGVDFDHAVFFETCSRNRGVLVNAFTDYDKAVLWILSSEDLPKTDILSDNTTAS